MLKWILTAVATLGLLFFMSGGISIPIQPDPDLRVEKPSLLGVEAYAQDAGVNFLKQEAGIAGYIQMDREIDLDSIRELFKTVETVSDQYIIGEIAIKKLPDYAHPHLYVNQQGWLVAYYSKNEPASKAIQWIGYKGKGMPDTTLRTVIGKVYKAMQLPTPQKVSYYNFEYPDATRIMVITKYVSSDAVKSFYITVPQGITLHSATTSIKQHGYGDGRYRLNDKWLAEWTSSYTYQDVTDRMTIGARHVFGVQNNDGRGNVQFGVIMIYGQGSK